MPFFIRKILRVLNLIFFQKKKLFFKKIRGNQVIFIKNGYFFLQNKKKFFLENQVIFIKN